MRTCRPRCWTTRCSPRATAWATCCGVLDQKKLDLQRGVVQNEKRQGENQPYGVTDELIVENTYPVGHPYSWTVIGSMKDLDAASMADVQEWFKTYYGPNNTIAGDRRRHHAGSRAAESREVLRRHSRRARRSPSRKPGSPSAPARIAAGCRTACRRRASTASGTCRNTASPEEALLDLAAQVLGGGKTSRLYKRLVYKDQLPPARPPATTRTKSPASSTSP